jgi:hypothetical protein
MYRFDGRDRRGVATDPKWASNRSKMRAEAEVEVMPNTTAKVRMGTKGAAAMARHPQLRRATVSAGKPPAKLGWKVGKVVVKRKARAQVERLGATGRTVALFAVIYGSMAAEVFGLVEAPKPKRRVPAFAAGILIGGGALYMLQRNRRDSARGPEPTHGG